MYFLLGVSRPHLNYVAKKIDESVPSTEFYEKPGNLGNNFGKVLKNLVPFPRSFRNSETFIESSLNQYETMLKSGNVLNQMVA